MNIIDEVPFGFIVLAPILGLFLVIAVLTAGVNQLKFPGQVAEIEQLRRDTSKVGVAQSEDVIGQVTQWNQRIAANKAYNQMPIIELFVPDGWDEIPLIEIP